MQQELNVVLRNVRNMQQMYFLDRNGRHTRGSDETGFFDLDGAYEQVRDNFNFDDGKDYIIKYLTNDGRPWKGGSAFTYRNGMDLRNHVYSAELSQEMYGEQALDDIHVYGIVVEEI